MIVRCEPYHCTLSVESCAKRHLATIANRGGRSSEAYPSCRRCPVGAANAAATGAPTTYAEHVSAYQVRHAPVMELHAQRGTSGRLVPRLGGQQ